MPALPIANNMRPLSQDDLPCIRDLRDVLLRHNALDRFGVWLLHEHFPLAEDETLIETEDPEGRRLLVTVAKKDSVGNAIETTWKLGRDQLLDPASMYRLKCVRDSSGFHETVHVNC